MTWTDVEELEAENVATGQFVPVIESRERGHYTDATDQVRFVVRIDNCDPGIDGTLRVEAVFQDWALSGEKRNRVRPVMFREWRQREDKVRPAGLPR